MAVCPQCAEHNEDRARFCWSCGMVLQALSRAEEVLKTVTMLFIDIVGSTALGDRLDAESLHQLLTRFFDQAAATLGAYGGVVRAWIGDAVLAVFGLPRAHEDDPIRGVRAALAIRNGLPDLNEQLKRDFGIRLRIRIGVNTGEVMAADPAAGQVLISGDAVNLAARLEQAAGEDEIYLGDATYLAVRHLIEAVPTELRVKGKPAPVRAWRLLGEAPESATGRRAAMQFVGRTAELAGLRNELARAIRLRRVHVASVIGEAGLGKSRLIAELRSEVENDTTASLWLQVACRAYGEQAAGWPIREVVASLASIADGHPAIDVSTRLEMAIARVIGDPSERRWMAARFRSLFGLERIDGQSGELEETVAAWRRFLEAVAAKEPLILCVEDVHWADRVTVRFLEHLGQSDAKVPLLMMVSARSTSDANLTTWMDGGRITKIELFPLRPEETETLVDQLLEGEVVPAEVHGKLIERIGGSPLYAEEFVGMITDQALLGEGTAATSLEEAASQLPSGVSALIASRIDALPKPRSSLLKDASVVGAIVWAGAVAAIEDRAPVDVARDLGELDGLGLVRSRPATSMLGDREYEFGHPLLREVAYGELPRARRGEKHLAVARWLESVGGDRIGDYAEILAFHYTTAFDLLPVRERPLLGDAVAAALAMAGDRAATLDPERASEYYARALDLMPSDTTSRATLLRKRAAADRDAGRFDVARLALTEAADLFRLQDDIVAEGESLGDLAETLWHLGETEAARGAASRAVALLKDRGPAPALAALYNELAFSLLTEGKPLAGLEYAERALSIARALGAREEEQDALALRGMTRCDAEDRDGIEDLRAALRLGLDLGLGRRTAATYHNLINAQIDDSPPEELLPIVQEGLLFAETRGLTGQAMFIRKSAADLFESLGRWAEALSEYLAVGEWSEKTHDRYLNTLSDSERARLLACRGALAAAEELVGELLPMARQIGDPQVLGPALRAAADVSLLGRNLAGAEAILEEFEVVSRGSPIRTLCLTDLARLAAGAGRPDLARVLVPATEPATARRRLAVHHAEALILEAEGRLAEAEQRFAALATEWIRWSELERGEALLGAGRCRIRLGRSGAVSAVKEAEGVFASLGARPFQSECRSLQVSTHRREEPVGRDGSSGPTPNPV